jgi:hypothetical protein
VTPCLSLWATSSRGVARSKQAPADYPGVALLAVAGACAGATRRLQVKQDWEEFPCLYTAVVAEPGGKKSPSFRPVLSPVYRRQKDASLRHEADKDTPLQHFYTTDFTREAMNKLLLESRRGVLLLQDELVEWIGGMNQYRSGKGTDRQYWLKVWSGAPVKVDRKGADTIYLHDTFVGVLGGIQPDMLSDLVDRLKREDGFVHRLLVCYPREDEEDDLSDDVLDPCLRDAWEATCNRLYSLDFADGQEPVDVRFTPEAFASWRAWYRGHQAQLKHPEFPRHLKGPWKKFKAYCARLALVVRLLDPANADGTQPVTCGDVDRAVTLVDYFKSHAVGVYARLRGSRLDEHLVRLRDLALAAPGRTVTLRAAMRAFRFKTKGETQALFKRAADLDLGDSITYTHPSNRRKVEAFVIPADGPEE